MRTMQLARLNVSAIGMGCMGFSHGYGEPTEHDEAIRLMRYAHERGCTFFDTAASYAAGRNESLVGEALAPIRDEIVLATKIHIPEDDERPVYDVLKERLTASLKRLRTDHVDLYYQHRVNRGIPVEDVAEAMGRLIDEGLTLGWGQSQPTESEVRRAHAVTPMTAMQCEFSMMERSFEKSVIPACRELGIGVVAFSPMASGFLSGKYATDAVYTGDDVRRVITRFAPENMAANQPVLDLLREYAAAKGATPAQIALAWILAKGIVPIPGMRRISRIDENLGAAAVSLTDDEYRRIEESLSRLTIHGDRTDEDIAKLKTMR
ncbi:aldo/keto reductase [Bifidobacterium eulemuris]|uniref:Aldo/keto reductase n=1 Tax=Bifidobacterium eulemuris TaxID=1765219 RepID=A0A261GDT9_9BIFI|nr:aldo/keto reductase [Bifidobacterium eulemuris]OZG69423.1 aldo/keto reductase [Bifidobacterium eulemuris]QOL31098.1 aldo/keto reductase [Bifidobacterium eulemuris]